VISDEPAWRLRAWDDVVLQDAFLRQGLIAIGGAEVGDLSDRPSDSELAARLRRGLPHRSARAVTVFIGYWRRFLTEMQLGDALALALVDNEVAIGEIRGEYIYVPASDPRLRHRRRIEWLSDPISRTELDEDLRRVVGAPGTLVRIRKPEAATRLRALARRAAHHQGRRGR
jgi:restriction system protein